MPLRVVAASAVAAAAREVGFVGGGMTAWLGDSNSGVVNILSRGEPGLFVMASRTTLRGGVLARCATMALVLDLAAPAGPRLSALGPRIFARELAVGAKSLDVVLVGLKMDALLPRLALVLLLLLLPLVPAAAIPASSSLGARLVDVEREMPTLSFMPVGGLALTEPARTL